MRQYFEVDDSMFSRKIAWKQWRPFIQRFVIGYGLVCLILYSQQKQLIFFLARQIEHTPSLYELEYQDVWISISQGERDERLHGWWIPVRQPDAPVMLYFHHNATNIGANVSQALQFHKLGYSVFLI